MRSIILEYPHQLDILTRNPKVKKYLIDIGYKDNITYRAYPNTYSYDDVWALHVWLGKLVWNVPSVKLDSYSFTDEVTRWELTKWVAGKDWDMPDL